MDIIFAKTAKGLAEMSARSGGLPPRMRRLLILVDGRRGIDELRALVQADDIRLTLGRLEEDGYIALAEGGPATATPDPAAMPAAPSPGDHARFGPLPAPADPRRLRAARKLMTEAIHNFVGPSGNAGLLRQIAEARSLEELRGVYGDWFELISSSLESPWEASDLRDQLLRVI